MDEIVGPLSQMYTLAILYILVGSVIIESARVDCKGLLFQVHMYNKGNDLNSLHKQLVNHLSF